MMAGMEPLLVLHLRLDVIGIVPWSVFSVEALDLLRRDIDAGELGPASIVEFENQQLEQAA